MSFGCYKDVFEPTCVRACAAGSFTRPRRDLAAQDAGPSSSSREVAVLKGSNLLELYQALDCEGGGGRTQIKFRLLRSVQLGGLVNEIETLPGRTTSQRDALVLLSESAQVSVIEYDPGADNAVDGFRTTSLHSFADHDAVTLARNESRARRRLRCDPQGRLCAMLFYSDFLALMPTREHNLDELFQADMAESAKAGEKNAQVPAAANRLNRGGDVISLLEVCKLSYVRDICFLHGYNEPVLCLLHESGSPQSASRGPTWSGRLRDAKDTCGIKAFSINTTHRRYPKLMEKSNLPYDAFAVKGVPGVGGKCLVLCSDYILLLDHRTMSAVAVNRFAYPGFAREIPMDKMDEPRGGDQQHSMNVLQARKNAYLVIPEVVSEVSKIAQNESAMMLDLNDCKLTWLECFKQKEGGGFGRVHGLLSLKSGQLVHFTLRIDSGSVRTSTASKVFEFKSCGSSSVPSCISVLSDTLVFLGSRLGNSALLRCRVTSSGSAKASSENLVEDEGSLAQEMMDKSAVGEGNEEDELEKALFTSEVATDHDALVLTVCDRLSNLGPILDMTTMSTDSSKKEDVAVAACVGHGKHGAIAILSQTWRYDKLLQVDLNDIKFLQTVHSFKGDEKDRLSEEHFHAYLVLSTSDSTMVLETKEELELITERMSFVTNFPTICAGNLLRKTRIVQVYKEGVRVMRGSEVEKDVGCKDLCEGQQSEIVDACVCDPYILFLLGDGTLGLLEGSADEKGRVVVNLGSERRRNVTCMSVVENRGGYFGASESHLAILCDASGGLEVISLPRLSSVFRSSAVHEGFKRLEEATSMKVEDGGDQRGEASLCVAQIDCQADRLTKELWVSFLLSDGFLYVYRLDQCQRTRGFFFSRVNILNEFLLVSEASSRVQRKMVRLENVNGHYGYFITGDNPYVVFVGQGQVRVYSASKDGPVTSITGFHNVNCNHGFVFATENGQVNVCNLNARFSSKFSWCAEVKHVGSTVHKITYSAETRVLAALVSKVIPYRKRKPEEGGGDAHATNVYAAQEAAVAAEAREESFEVQLISAETLEVLWSHALAPAEIGLSISSVYIKNQTDESMSSIIAVGTATPRGEDYPCRGNVYLFKIEKQDIPNAELGQPRVKWGGSLVSTKDFRGAPGGGGVHVVSCLDGYLLVGIGIKVLLFKWNGEYPPATPPGYPDIPQLEQCGFFDSTLFTSSLATVKKFVLSGDSMRGIHFLRWLDQGNDSRKVLQLLSHDFSKPPIHHVQFLIDGSTLTIMGVDMFGNIRTYAFDPSDPDSFKGKKLLGRSVFYSGSRVSRVGRITAKAPSDSPAATVSHRIGVCLSTYDASLGMLFPLDETTFKRLQSLQNKLITSVIQVAGLNPHKFRQAKYADTAPGEAQGSEKILDGSVVWKYLQLTTEEQNDMARLIGSRRETVLKNLRALSRSMFIY